LDLLLEAREVYADMHSWEAIRRRVLREGVSVNAGLSFAISPAWDSPPAGGNGSSFRSGLKSNRALMMLRQRRFGEGVRRVGGVYPAVSGSEPQVL